MIQPAVASFYAQDSNVLLLPELCSHHSFLPAACAIIADHGADN